MAPSGQPISAALALAETNGIASPRRWSGARFRASRLKSKTVYALRQFLARYGVALTTTGGSPSESLDSFVQRVILAGLPQSRVVILDNDAEPLRTFLRHYPTNAVYCGSPGQAMEPMLSSSAADSTVIEFDASCTTSVGVLLEQRLLGQARWVLARFKPASAARVQADPLELLETVQRFGFCVHDAVRRPVSSFAEHEAESIYIACCRGDTPNKESRRLRANRLTRVSEAIIVLSRPIVPSSQFRRLLARGQYGMQGGLCNPGAVQIEGRILLLPRGERYPWPIQKRRWSNFVSSCQPYAIELGQDLNAAAATALAFDPPLSAAGPRHEDFRLFTHAGRLYANHSVLMPHEITAPEDPFHPERLVSRIGVSRVDVAERSLVFLGTVRLDRALERAEKNWAMFSDEAGVHLIYSFNPYRLFSTARFPHLEFLRSIDRDLQLPLPDADAALRNSIDPVPYDEAYYLHIVHRVYPTKRYVFWAVLIDRVTRMPVKFAPRPLIRAASAGNSSILYVCSAVVRDAEVILFGGLDDCSVGSWRIARAELDSEWQSLPQ